VSEANAVAVGVAVGVAVLVYERSEWFWRTKMVQDSGCKTSAMLLNLAPS